MIHCPHWAKLGHNTGTCDVGHYGGKPSHGVCHSACMFRNPGDAASDVLEPIASPVLPAPTPCPRDQWPAFAVAVAALATAGDVGVGSTIKRLLGSFGEAYKAVLRGMGVDCGCDARAAEWDVMYRY